MTSFVVDANVAFELVCAPGALDRLSDEEMIAPPLLWPEVRSALHVGRTRRLVSPEDAQIGLQLLESGAFRERRHRRLGLRAWEIADALGWSKTYDAEYLALAELSSAPIASFDRRVLRAATIVGVPHYDLRSNG